MAATVIGAVSDGSPSLAQEVDCDLQSPTTYGFARRQEGKASRLFVEAILDVPQVLQNDRQLLPPKVDVLRECSCIVGTWHRQVDDSRPTR